MKEMRRFTSARVRSAKKNLDEFIDVARRSIPFDNVKWKTNKWVIETTARSSSSQQNIGLTFARNSKVPKGKSLESFQEPFCSFVKAVICKRAKARIKQISPGNHAVMVRACRYLYESLVTRANSPTELTPADFDQAGNSVIRREAESTAYSIGGKLQELAEIIDRYGLTPVPLGWINSLRRPDSYGGSMQSRIGSKFDERRSSKYLSDDVLAALADISNRSDLSEQDLLCQRAIDILACAPFRINENLTIPRDMWVEEVARDKHGKPILEESGKPIVRYGLRYFPEKGGHTKTQVKPLPTVMVDVARRAVKDILNITNPYAEVAKVLYKQPGHTLLGEPWDSLKRSHPLSANDVALAIGRRCSNSFQSGVDFITRRNITVKKSIEEKPRTWTVQKKDLERALAAMSRVGNMFKRDGINQPLYKALFVLPVNFFSNRPLIKGTARPVTDQNIRTYLCGREGAHSIFERLGYKDKNEQPFKITSNNFRHWLNTLALEGGLSEHILARWSGRKRIADNAAYDHESGLDMARRVRMKLNNGEAIGPIPEYVQTIRDPIDRQEFIDTMVHTAHVTELGGCLHDWSVDPCAKHGACTYCPEHIIIKGDPIQKNRAEVMLKDTRRLIEQAEKELADGTYGANNWLVHHKKVAARLERILAVHNDPNIPDGTIVYLRTTETEAVISKVNNEETSKAQIS